MKNLFLQGDNFIAANGKSDIIMKKILKRVKGSVDICLIKNLVR